MNRIISVNIILLFSLSLNGQIWNTQINYENTEYLDARPGLIETSDGGMIYLYDRFDNPPILNDRFTHSLVKYTSQGELVWEKLYSQYESIGINVGLNSKGVTEMPNEEIVVFGRVRSADIAYLYHTNNLGDSLLYRSYEQYLFFEQGIPLDDDHITVHAVDGVTSDRYILKIELTSGEIIQESLVENYTVKSHVVLSSLNDYYFLFTEEEDSLHLFKFTNTGSLLSDNSVALPDGFKFNTASRTSKNIGHDASSFFIFNNAVLSISEDLSVNFSVSFNSGSLNVNDYLDEHISEYVLSTSDGGCLLSGTFNVPGGDYIDQQIYFIKLDENGVEEWSELYGFWVFDSHYVPALIEVSDGYVFVRHSYSTGKIFITKIAKDGSLKPSFVNDIIPINFEVYPNPSANYIHISEINSETEWILNIYELNGELIKTIESFYVRQNSISVTEFTPGTYILRGIGKTSNEIFIGKFVKI